MIGCGGLGGWSSIGMVRKGLGRLTLVDHDTVALSNLARQPYRLTDVGQNKALALARILRDHATGGTELRGHAVSFQQALSEGRDIDVGVDVVVVGVDNNTTRLDVAMHFQHLGIPVVFLAVDDTASRGYAFVQTSRPGEACFACLFPDAHADPSVHGCAGASIEILMVVVGMGLYALDSLLMQRPRPWNYKDIYLDRAGDGLRVIAQRPGCSLCGTHDGAR